MKFTATQKYILTSPRKLREITGIVNGLTPSTAFERLAYVDKAAALLVRKVIGTAIANAKQKSVSETDLVFQTLEIGEGPRLKRFRAGSRGRAKPYKRRMSHIRVVLKVDDSKKTEKAVEKKEVIKSAKIVSTKPAKKEKKSK